MPRLTKKIVEAAFAEEGRPKYVWDDQIPGFGVKVLSGETRRYVFKYRAGAGGRAATQRWLTIGTHGAITCDQAREIAREAAAAVARGEDPQEEKNKRRRAPTMTDLWERFADEQLPLKKSATANGYRQNWRDFIEPEFGKRPVTEIRQEAIDRLHKRLRGTPYQANRVLALLSRLFNLAEKWGFRDLGTNPCRFVEHFKETSRERFLSDDEIGRLGKAIQEALAKEDISFEAAAAIRLLPLTGARLNEVLTAKWEWVAPDNRTISLPTSKTGKKQLFLSHPAVAIVEELRQQQDSRVAGKGDSQPYLLPGRSKGKPLNNLSKPWRRICVRAGLAGVRLHDLRHTAASIAVNQGASLSLVGRLLGHTQPQTTNRYAHVDVDPALKVADLIGENVLAALSKVSKPGA